MHLAAQSRVRSQAPTQLGQPLNPQGSRRPRGLRLGLVALVGWALAETFPFPQQPAPGLPITASPSAPEAATTARVQATFDQLPLYFIANQGQQVDKRVAYYVQGRDTTLYFTPQGITFALSSPPAYPAASPAALRPIALGPPREEPEARQGWELRLDFVGANLQVTPKGQDPTAAVVSYFKGKEQWQTGLKSYATLVYPELWPGIDLVYSGTVTRLEYTFVVKPGADPQQIKLAYQGATAVTLSASREFAKLLGAWALLRRWATLWATRTIKFLGKNRWSPAVKTFPKAFFTGAPDNFSNSLTPLGEFA